MSKSEGMVIFESYLFSIEQGGHDLTINSSDRELDTHYDEFLQSELSPKYNDPELEFVREFASDAFDIKKVRKYL